ncbi:uncharacterized protein LOC123525778 [Mercenaria mercenaria]|uniref:uncharacterized protein LOC123525778 n=1 Tax=Mercenaria mercenaria TaxID=6596 RepID=UPI00234E95E0|nr:uncharacterized protein LOC123525778 [Mercenaria mercenaria]
MPNKNDPEKTNGANKDDDYKNSDDDDGCDDNDEVDADPDDVYTQAEEVQEPEKQCRFRQYLFDALHRCGVVHISDEGTEEIYESFLAFFFEGESVTPHATEPVTPYTNDSRKRARSSSSTMPSSTNRKSKQVLLDMSAAFDTIDHGTLLHRLEHHFGIAGKPVEWVKSCLDERYQTVCIDGEVSNPILMKCSVPQGSVLEPKFFTMYTKHVGAICQRKKSLKEQRDDTTMSGDHNTSFYQYRHDKVSVENTSIKNNIHWFLIPAVAVIILLSFMEKRKYVKPDLLGGRPALVSPFGFLDEPRNRWGMMFVFGAVTGNIVRVTQKTLTQEVGVPKWAKIFLVYILCLEISVISYPLFACMTNRNKLIGGITGLVYAVGWFGYELFVTIQFARCSSLSIDPVTTLDMKGYKIGMEVPTLVFSFLVVLKFSWKIYKCFKKGTHSDSDQALSNLCRSYHLTYVKYLLKRNCLQQYDGKRSRSLMEKIRNMIMHPVPGFRFPISIMITVFMSAVMLYLTNLALALFVDVFSKLYLKSKPDIQDLLQGETII